MLRSLKIEGFRAFETSRVPQLSNLNLFVGGNSSGKTTILEGIEILLGDKPDAVWRGPLRRGELSKEAQDGRDPEVTQLFHEYRFGLGAGFRIGSENDGGPFVAVKVVPFEEQPALLRDESYELGLQLDSGEEKPPVWPLTDTGRIPGSVMRRRRPGHADTAGEAVSFINTGGVPPELLGELWGDVVLTPEEEMVIEVLRIVEPDIERLAFMERRGHGGDFVVKRHSVPHRLPLGSMGEGMKRLLALSVCLARSKANFLLIDEIDTGLHHTTLSAMWAMLAQAACRLRTQVFATTHSLDCVRVIGELHRSSPEVADQIALFRVERGAAEAVRYRAEEIATALDHDMEIR